MHRSFLRFAEMYIPFPGAGHCCIELNVLYFLCNYHLSIAVSVGWVEAVDASTSVSVGQLETGVAITCVDAGTVLNRLVSAAFRAPLRRFSTIVCKWSSQILHSSGGSNTF